MRKAHAQAFLEAEHNPLTDILVVVQHRKGRTRPALPPEIYKYIDDVDYDADSKNTVVHWHNGSQIRLIFIDTKDQIRGMRAKIIILDGCEEEWCDEFLEEYIYPMEQCRFFNQDLVETVAILTGDDMHPHNCTPKIMFV